jgi:hypothetical protein
MRVSAWARAYRVNQRTSHDTRTNNDIQSSNRPGPPFRLPANLTALLALGQNGSPMMPTYTSA